MRTYVDDKYRFVGQPPRAGRVTEALELLTGYRWEQKTYGDETQSTLQRFIGGLKQLKTHFNKQTYGCCG